MRAFPELVVSPRFVKSSAKKQTNLAGSKEEAGLALAVDPLPVAWQSEQAYETAQPYQCQAKGKARNSDKTPHFALSEPYSVGTKLHHSLSHRTFC